MKTIVWYRGKDLRVADHEPLLRAREQGDAFPVFVLSQRYFGPDAGAVAPHRVQFLLDSLVALDGDLRALGSRLVVLEGPSNVAIPRAVRRLDADAVFAHATVEPRGRRRDAGVRARLTVPLRLFDGETLLPPGSVRTQAGGVYQVFTPFGRAARAQLGPVRPLAAPQNLNPAPPLDGFEVPIPTLEGARNPAVLAGGEGAALARATRFFDERVHAYDAARDIPSQPGTSRISQDLKFGTISVRTVWAMAADLVGESAHRFQNEILWREFAYHTLAARPGLLERPFRSDWEGFAWVSDPAGWEAWTQGRTGYPIVDAAARQLLEEGFVHNRARMIAASFLCKHLMIDYRDGEAHYLRWLTDGDPAQNNLGWQWSAGCGCDAQPYFRVFNPISQGKKFDADGEYVRRYVPELARMPKRYIHAPWQAPISVQEAFGVRIGRDYPAPVVEHALARRAFLDTAKRHLVRARAMAS